MININSIACSLAFAPYLLDSFHSFIATGTVIPAVVRQAATGLILRAEDNLIIHYQNRDAILNLGAAHHFFETVEFRQRHFLISRTSNEVVMANFANQILISHPQSEIWLNLQETAGLLASFNKRVQGTYTGLPAWLSVSSTAGSLLISDGRTGRWVLLGEDHREELERRLTVGDVITGIHPIEKPPTINLKGLTLHLQLANRLLQTLDEYSTNGSFSPYDEASPGYSLQVAQSIDGMKITDGNVMITILPKEARKWVAILEFEMEKLKARELHRGDLKTVLAKSDSGYWILQRGDVVCIPIDRREECLCQSPEPGNGERLISGEGDRFRLILDKSTGACVGLSGEELNILLDF